MTRLEPWGKLAHRLTQTDFDAVERDGLRAEYVGTSIVVTTYPGEETVAMFDVDGVEKAGGPEDVRRACELDESDDVDL